MDTETSAELRELDKDFVKLDKLIGPKPKRKSAKKKVAKKAKVVTVLFRDLAKKTTKRKPAKRAVKAKVEGRRPDISGLSRIDLRLTKKQKTKLAKKAKAQMRTVTSVMLELIDKMK